MISTRMRLTGTGRRTWRGSPGGTAHRACVGGVTIARGGGDTSERKGDRDHEASRTIPDDETMPVAVEKTQPLARRGEPDAFTEEVRFVLRARAVVGDVDFQRLR